MLKRIRESILKTFYSFDDVTDLSKLSSLALKFKRAPLHKKSIGEEKTLGLVFLNPSLRTRISTQKAAMNLGVQTIILNIEKEGWGLETEEGTVMKGTAGEHIKEAAAVLGEYCDLIGIRSFATLKDKKEDYLDKVFTGFREYCNVPIINLESTLYHPLQGFADLITILETKTSTKPKIVLTWAPHPKSLPHAVPNSFCKWMLGAGFDLSIACPKGYELDPQIVGPIKQLNNQNLALEGADYVYAKNWSSIENYGVNSCTDPSWMLDDKKMGLTKQGKFMHCLPIRRNVVATDSVIDSTTSLIKNQANNRVYATQAILYNLIQGLNDYE